MNELIPPPDPLGIPSSQPIFLVLLWLTFVLHVIFMNFVLGGTLILTIQEWLMGRDSRVGKASSLMMKVMPVTLSLAITMGVAPLLFVQVLYGQFFYTANIMLGFIWLSIFLLVMTAFYLLYVLLIRRSNQTGPNMTSRAILIINTVIFLCVAFIFTNNATLTEHPQEWAAIFSGEANWISDDISLWPRYLHNVIGAVAVAGMWMSGIALYRRKYRPSEQDTSYWMYRSGLLWAKGATFLNILIGFLYLFSLGMDRIRAMMDGGVMLIGWGISVIAAFGALALMVAAFIKPDKPGIFWGACGTLFLTLFGMSMGRDLVRQVSLEMYGNFTLDQLAVRPHFTSLAMFLVTFVIGLITLAYMVKLIWTIPPKDAESAGSGDGGLLG